VSTHGDFVSKGLPASFIDPWDAWLQEIVVGSQQQLGDDWLNYYLTSPIYRFVLAPGICGENGWLGIMIPSVDRVGRYYPMTIVTMNHLNINPFVALEHATEWFTKVEALALSSLDDNFNLQQFNREIDVLKAEVLFNNCEPLIPTEQITKQMTTHAWQSSMEGNQTISTVLPCFLDNLLKEHCFAYSLWWTQGSEQVASSLLICEGLPPFEGAAALLDGNWQKWGWEGFRYPGLPFGAK
jgi:type VI secretion system protein ImpM